VPFGTSHHHSRFAFRSLKAKPLSDWIDTYVEETAEVPSPPQYRLWSAITAVSGVLERKVWTVGSAGPIYPNMLTLLVGPPATGKTNAIRPIRDLWAKIQGLHIAPDDVTKASLIDALSEATRTVITNSTQAYSFSALVAPVSEFGVFFPNYDLSFLSIINNIYDSPAVHTEKRRINGELTINKPYIVMLAGTQPDFLNALMPETAWGMGFTSRLTMIYAGEAPPSDLFAKVTVKSSSLARDLGKIFTYNGEYAWSKNAADELNAWHRAGCPPAPSHSRLTHYNGRRSLNAIKLSMISAASRSPELIVTVEDVERAKSWLLEAEKLMPDIFRAMGQRSDSQIIADMHYAMYKKWSAVALGSRKAVSTEDLYSFLYSRVPSEKIPRLIEVAWRTGFFRKGSFPDEWVPQSVQSFGTM
jgi:hypothetical protein